MLTLRATRTTTDTGGRVELILSGGALPPQLQGPIFFELSGSDVADFDVLDGFMNGLIHFLMETRQLLHVEGRLSRTYLRSIAEYQRFWSLVRPERCSVVKITADEVVTDSSDQRDLPAVATFSGGLDSAFTVIRHKLKLTGMDTIPLDAVLIIHGFDVLSSDVSGFARLLDRLQPLIEELGLRRYVVRTNLKELALQNWVESYAAQLTSCLHMVGHRHTSAIIASDGYGQSQVFEYGGNPISVPLLTSSRLKFFYDGPSYSRIGKAALLAKYPSFVRTLKFCYEGPDPAENCGHCMKCFLTYTNFRAVGLENPECFDTPVNEEMVGNYTIKNDAELALRYPLLEQLRQRPELAELTARFAEPVVRYEEQVRLREANEFFEDEHSGAPSTAEAETPKAEVVASTADIEDFTTEAETQANLNANLEPDAELINVGDVPEPTAATDLPGPIKSAIQFLQNLKASLRL